MCGLSRLRAIASGFALLCLVVSVPRVASAEAPGPRTMPVHVLGIDSDDAEDQADALTGAIRSRVRSAPAWSLQETQHSLSMLTAALRCPPKPDAACLQRIADQLRTDRYVWGVMWKTPGNQVTTELHLWARGRPDISTRETYSDNLQDQNDEILRKIAARIFDKLAAATRGTITIHAGDAEGVVLISGQKPRTLEHGTAAIELPPGRYDMELRAQGFTPVQDEGIVVNPGQDTSVAVKLVPIVPPTVASARSRPRSGHAVRVIGWTLVGLGVAAEIVAGIEGLQFLSAKNDLDNERAQIPASVSDVCANSTDVQFSSQPAATAACAKYNAASTDRTVAWVAGGAGGVALIGGVVMLLADGLKDSSDKANSSTEQARLPRFQVVPHASLRGNGAGLDLAFTF